MDCVKLKALAGELRKGYWWQFANERVIQIRRVPPRRTDRRPEYDERGHHHRKKPAEAREHAGNHQPRASIGIVRCNGRLGG